MQALGIYRRAKSFDETGYHCRRSVDFYNSGGENER